MTNQKHSIVSPLEARQFFEELAFMLGGKFIMSVYAYADESGTNQDKSVVVIAGWVSTHERWGTFCEQWQAMLTEHGAPYIHMKELGDEARRKTGSKFYKWPWYKVDALVSAAIPIVRDNSVFGMVCTISVAGYNKIDPRIRVDYSSPYVLAFQLYFEQLLKVLNNQTEKPFDHGIDPSESCNLVFDQNDCEVDVLKAFEFLKKFKPHGYRYGNIAFGNSRPNDRGQEVILPLQGADLLANRLYKVYRKEVVQKQKIAATGWDAELKAKGNLFLSYIDEEKCADFVRRIKEKNRLV